MKQFFRDMGIGERFLAAGIILLMAITAVIIAAVCYKAADEIGITPVGKLSVAVEEKDFTPAHTEIYYSNSGKTSTAHTIFYNEKCDIGFHLFGVHHRMNVRRGIYEELKEGDSVTVTYGRGRFSGNSVPISVARIVIAETQ